jgi:rubrerythrin
MLKDIQYLNLLKKALEIELSDIFSYHKEAELFERKLNNGGHIASLFREISKTEVRHADIISAELVRLGESSVPGLSGFELSDSIHIALNRHIENEAAGLALYQSIMEHNNETQFDIELKGISVNEKEHLVKLKDIRSKLEP